MPEGCSRSFIRYLLHLFVTHSSQVSTMPEVLKISQGARFSAVLAALKAGPGWSQLKREMDLAVIKVCVLSLSLSLSLRRH